jgi:hypothetical protein
LTVLDFSKCFSDIHTPISIRPKKNMCVYCHMSKKSRVGRSGLSFLLFNQQQCFIYSTASLLSKLRAKKVEKLHNSSFYRNFRKLNTGIGFRNRERLFPVLSIIKKKNPDRPDPRFFWHVTVNTHIFKHTYIFFGLVNVIRWFWLED